MNGDNSALWADFDRLLTQYERSRKDLTTVQEGMRDSRATAESEDGLIKATVGPHGTLADLEISPRAHRRLGPTQMAETIVATVEKAAAAMNKRAEELLAPFLPNGVSLAELKSGQIDFASWLPKEPLTAENFDEWWGQFGGPPRNGSEA